MARPRQFRNKDLPTGLLYRKDRQCYEFKRIDGSKISLGKDRSKAKMLAIKYNATYRVDIELTREICSTKLESANLKFNKKPILNFLPDIFIKVSEDKQWVENTLKNHKNRFTLILDFFGKLQPDSIQLEHINMFLKSVNKNDSKEVYNRYLGLLKTLFDYCVSESLMNENPARKKIRRTINAKDEATITRLTVSDFSKIHDEAGKKGLKWLQIAMELSLQTSHAVLEISKLKYTDIEDHIRIQRQKNKKVSASRVLIPLNEELKSIVERSRDSNMLSPFVVHYIRKTKDQKRSLGVGLEHVTQLSPEQISRAFSSIRDQLGLFDNTENRRDRPSFHDIRALSISIQESNGFDAQKRASHSQRSTTEGYIKGHVKWNEVPDITVDWRQ